MSLLTDLEDLQQSAAKDLQAVQNLTELENFRIAVLGRSGSLSALMPRIKEVAAAEKKLAGQRLNAVKTALQTLYEQRKNALESADSGNPGYDPTLPGLPPTIQQLHPLTQTIERIAVIFEKMGFSWVDGPEMEEEFYNFDALNIPADHPARDSFDTFFLDNKRILRSQTSTVQVRVMQNLKPPLRIFAPGRVYRPDSVDATHFYSFTQLEGLAVDENITFADLKAVLDLFAKELFGQETKTRLRPSFFPFTEPSAELDVSCIFCKDGCRICKHSGWIEVLGCGMVDPNVFDQVGYDAERWTGFAFGMGIERVTMLSLGINDIRLFTENDLRFLRQFA